MNKLHNKDFSIAFKTGTDANKSKFKKECVQGEIYHATDTGFFYIAEVTAGASDATLSKFGATPFSNTYSVDFDGTNDHASTAFVTDDYDLKDGFTVSLWVNLDSVSGTQDFFGRYGSSTARFYFGISGSNLRVAIGTSFDTTSLSHGLSAGSWSHVAYTFSGGSGGTFTYYVNGSSVGTISFTWTNDRSDYEPMHIGALKNGTNTNQNPTNGKLDEMAIFNSALSASDISNIYNSGEPADLSSHSPVGWWRMGDNDGGTGTTITDQGSGGNDATLTNGPTFSTSVP